MPFSKKKEEDTKHWASWSYEVCILAKRSINIATCQKCKQTGCEATYEWAHCEIAVSAVTCMSKYHTSKMYEEYYKAWKWILE